MDAFCTRIRGRINGGFDLPFVVNDRGFLVRMVESNPQIVVPHSLQQRVLHLSHYVKLGAHPGGRKLYLTLRRDFYWPAMAFDCYAVSRSCTDCARNNVKLRRYSKNLSLFPARAPLEFIAIDILGELIKTARGNRFLLVITDRFSKLVRTVPLKRITARAVAQAFVTHWVFSYGPSVILLSDNGPQFTAKFFQDVCRILDIKNVFTTTYHPQSNGQVERFNRTMLNALRSYVADHPKDWDLYTDAITYAYNTQVHRDTSLSPFELVLSRIPPPVSIEAEPTVSAYPSPGQYRDAWKSWLKKIVPVARKAMEKAQLSYKRNFDSRVRRPLPSIRVDEYVFLRKEYYNPEKERRHKLSPIADGPYRVVEVASDTVVLDIDNQRERISRDRVSLAPNPNLELATGTIASGDSEQEESAPSDVVAPRPSVLPHPDRDLMDLPTEGDSRLRDVTQSARVVSTDSTRVHPPPHLIRETVAPTKEGEGTVDRIANDNPSSHGSPVSGTRSTFANGGVSPNENTHTGVVSQAGKDGCTPSSVTPVGNALRTPHVASSDSSGDRAAKELSVDPDLPLAVDDEDPTSDPTWMALWTPE